MKHSEERARLIELLRNMPMDFDWGQRADAILALTPAPRTPGTVEVCKECRREYAGECRNIPQFAAQLTLANFSAPPDKKLSPDANYRELAASLCPCNPPPPEEPQP